MVYLKVDTVNKYPLGGKGRPSLRLTSKNIYTHGLFILDVEHMPTGCGTWPAYWLLGPNWPNNGEIDIIEGANVDTNNHMTLHTSLNCSVSGLNQTATYERADCAYHPPSDNYGCGNTDPRTNSYGPGLNAVKGGVFATEWTSNWIRVWFFPRNGTIPPSILSGSPNPAQDFGVPAVNFAGNCKFDAHFAQQQIIFNTDFCGDWAGNTYAYTSCPQTSGLSGWDSCVTFVGNNPQNFTEAYWGIRSLRVFQQPSGQSYSTVSAPVVSSAPLPLASVSSIPAIDGGMGLPNVSETPVEVQIGNATVSESLSSTSTYEGPNTITTETEATPTGLACPGSDGYTYDSGNGYLFQIECYTDHPGGDMPPPGPYFDISSLEGCIQLCKARPSCIDVSWVVGSNACYLKSQLGPSQSQHGVYGAFLVATPTSSFSSSLTSSQSSIFIATSKISSPTSSSFQIWSSSFTSTVGHSTIVQSTSDVPKSSLPSIHTTNLLSNPTTNQMLPTSSPIVGSFATTRLLAASALSSLMPSSSSISSTSSANSLPVLASSVTLSSSPASSSLSTWSEVPAAGTGRTSLVSSNTVQVSQASSTTLPAPTTGNGSKYIVISTQSTTSAPQIESNSPSASASGSSTMVSTPSPASTPVFFTNATFSGAVRYDSEAGLIEFGGSSNMSNASVTVKVNLSINRSYQLHFSLRLRFPQIIHRDAVKRQSQNDSCVLNILADNQTVFTLPLEALSTDFEDFDSESFTPSNYSVPLTIVEQCGAETTLLDVDVANMILDILSQLEATSSSLLPVSSGTFASSVSTSATVLPLTVSTASTVSLVVAQDSAILGSSGTMSLLPVLTMPATALNTAISFTGNATFASRSASVFSAAWPYSNMALPTCPRRTTTYSITATVTMCPSSCPIPVQSNWASSKTTSCTSTFGLCFDCALTPALGWFGDCTSTKAPLATAVVQTMQSISQLNSANVVLTLFPASSSPSPSPIVRKSTDPPNCDDIKLYGDPFNDAYGMTWLIYCDSEFIDMQRDVSGQNSYQSSFVSCVTTCDLYNIKHFDEPSPCVAITWTANSTDLDGNNCFLKGSAAHMVPHLGYHSAKLLTLYAGSNNTFPASSPSALSGVSALFPLQTVFTSYALQQPTQMLSVSNSLSISTEVIVVTNYSQSMSLASTTALTTITNTHVTVITQTSLSSFTTIVDNTPSLTTITVTQPVTNTELTTFTSLLTETTGGATVTFIQTSTRLHTFTLTPVAVTTTLPGTRLTTTTIVSYVIYSSTMHTPSFYCRPQQTNYLNGQPAVTILPLGDFKKRKRNAIEAAADV